MSTITKGSVAGLVTCVMTGLGWGLLPPAGRAASGPIAVLPRATNMPELRAALKPLAEKQIRFVQMMVFLTYREEGMDSWPDPVARLSFSSLDVDPEGAWLQALDKRVGEKDAFYCTAKAFLMQHMGQGTVAERAKLLEIGHLGGIRMASIDLAGLVLEYPEAADALQSMKLTKAGAWGLLMQYAQQGHPLACGKVGNCYVWGRHVPRDVEAGMEWCERGAQGGDADSFGILAYALRANWGKFSCWWADDAVRLEGARRGSPECLKGMQSWPFPESLMKLPEVERPFGLSDPMSLTKEEAEKYLDKVASLDSISSAPSCLRAIESMYAARVLFPVVSADRPGPGKYQRMRMNTRGTRRDAIRLAIPPGRHAACVLALAYPKDVQIRFMLWPSAYALFQYDVTRLPDAPPGAPWPQECRATLLTLPEWRLAPGKEHIFHMEFTTDDPLDFYVRLVQQEPGKREPGSQKAQLELLGIEVPGVTKPMEATPKITTGQAGS